MSTGNRPKIIGIEFLRFISALGIVIWHYQHFAFADNRIDMDMKLQPFYWLFWPLYTYGNLAVEVFWCVSGFVMFFKYFDDLAQRKVGLREFSLNRFSRLYPLHLITLLVVALLQPIYKSLHGYCFVYTYNDIKHFILNVLFMNCWGFQSGSSFNAPTWSVSIEVMIYIIFFVLISRTRLFWAYFSALSLFAIFQLLGMPSTSECLGYFFVGGAIALCKYFPQAISTKKFFKNHAFFFLGGVLFLVFFCLILLQRFNVHPAKASIFLRYTTIAAIVYVFVAVNRIFLYHKNFWIFLGNLTYSSYLTQFPIQLLFVLLLPYLGFAINYKSPALFLSFLSVTFAVSVVVYRYVEMPLQRRIRRLYSNIGETKPSNG